jgi:hypothetical protein
MPSYSKHVPRRIGRQANMLLGFDDPGFALIEPVAIAVHFQDVNPPLRAGAN